MTANDPLQGVAYEFSEEQNQVIGRLGRYMRILGIFASGREPTDICSAIRNSPDRSGRQNVHGALDAGSRPRLRE